MEKVLVTPEELASRFRSKMDLYNAQTIDSEPILPLTYLGQLLLPSYSHWPLEFLKSLIKGDKQVSD